MWQLIVALAGSYLLGSIPTAYLVVKRMARLDVRTVGSGNVGATNAARAAGWGAGLTVFLLDVGKGLLAVQLLAPWLVHPVNPAVRFGCGLMAVIGHAFPLFLKFRGGKGVATTIGVVLGTMPLVAALCLLVWVSCFLPWRYVSVASLASAVMLPVAQALTRRSQAEILLGTALALLVIARHRSNIERLRQGTEHRVERRAPMCGTRER